MSVYQVVSAILYRLKTGCQWRELPMKQFFRCKYSWKSVYYHFQKWSKLGSWDKVHQQILERHKHLLDLSSIQLDGTHTVCKRGGAAAAYQGRKRATTTNLLLITDNQGIPLACSHPIAGNHNDAHHLVTHFKEMLHKIEDCNISTQGLFLNADAGFDVNDFRMYCNNNEIIDNICANKRNGTQNAFLFDELLYKRRFVIERTNAWIDAFKAILIRFETNQIHWEALHTLAFCLILIRKL